MSFKNIKLTKYHVYGCLIICVMICIIVYMGLSAYKYPKIMIANPHYIVDGENYIQRNQIRVDKRTGYISFKDNISNKNNEDSLLKQGKILTLDEFAENISDYYNVLITALSSLFVLFSIVVYLYFGHKTKQEEDALSSKLEERILNRIENELRDSVELRDSFQASYKTSLEEKFVMHSDFDAISDIIKTLRQDVDALQVKKEEQEADGAEIIEN